MGPRRWRSGNLQKTQSVTFRFRTRIRWRIVFLLSCAENSFHALAMSLQEQIDQDIKEAMKARQAERLGVLRMLKSAVKNVAIEKGGASAVLDDPEVSAVIRKQVKQRMDSIEGFEKGGRPELAAKERAEIEVLSTYLPKALSEEELSALVKEAVAEAGATSKAQMGAVMKIATAKAAGRVDGKSLSQEVQRQLP